MEPVIRRMVNFETERECRFALHWLNIVVKLNRPSQAGSNLDTLNQQINEMLNSLSVAGTQTIKRDNILRDLERAVKENILTDADLAWLKRNAIVTLCFWWQLRTQRHAIFFRDKNHRWGNVEDILSTLPEGDVDQLLSITCTSQDERFKCIVSYLDSLVVSPSEITYSKAELLEKIKNGYINERQVRLSSGWLVQKDEEACRWAWKYISDYQRKHRLKKNKNNPNNIITGGYFISDYSPDESSSDEYVLAIYAAFELWGEGDDARELFISKINRAWNQYNLRRTRKDKKPVNCYVKNATKKKLEKYCKATDKTITEVIEALINNHCKPPF